MKKTNLLAALLSAAALVAAGLGTSAVLVTPATADIATSKPLVDAAKKAGTVGEKPNGFLGVITTVDAATSAAVGEINAGRLDLYRQAAVKNNVSIDAAGQSAFVNFILPRLQPGEYYQDAAGAWVKK